jgi:alpha-1,3-rhamnosyl/mannosyltransferase
MRRVERFVRGARHLHAAVAGLRGAAYVRSVETRRLDAFHAFMYRAPGLLPTIPVIPVVYDLSHVRHPEFHPASRVRWMEPVADACRIAPAVHTISEFTAGEIAREFGVERARIHVVPPAVSEVFRGPALADDGARRRLGLPPGGYALTVSTLEPRKNLATLLDAHGRLTPAERARLPLVVVGTSGWGDVRLTDHPLVRAGTVRLAGYVTDAELAGLYRAARVMLYPSIYEGYGMPVIEALATGAPVVASDAASMPEALGGAGRLVAPNDIDGWTAIFREAAAGPACDTEADRAARVARATAWTWHDAALATRALYDAVG